MAMAAFPSSFLLSSPTHFLTSPPPLAFHRSRKFSEPQLPFVDRCFCCSSGSEGEKDTTAGPRNGREKAFKMAMPIIAAAVLGCTRDFAHAEDWRSISMPMSNLEVMKGQDSYETLLQKIQESRQRSLFPQVGESQSIGEREDSSITSNLRVQKLKDAAENAREYGAARKTIFGQTDSIGARAPSPLALEKPRPTNSQAQTTSTTTSTKSEKKRTHGFLPLFVSQFLLLVATIGGGAALFVFPDSYWKELQKKLENNFEKASPLLEEAFIKSQPLVTKALEKTQEVATQAKPYIRQALKAARPLAQQAFEASKPVLREAQIKASEFLQQAQEKAKNLNQQ